MPKSSCIVIDSAGQLMALSLQSPGMLIFIVVFLRQPAFYREIVIVFSSLPSTFTYSRLLSAYSTHVDVTRIISRSAVLREPLTYNSTNRFPSEASLEFFKSSSSSTSYVVVSSRPRHLMHRFLPLTSRSRHAHVFYRWSVRRIR